MESVVGCQIIQDLRWFKTSQVWALHLRLMPPWLLATELVPSSTDWFLTVEEDYPSGRIGLYPAEEGGLTRTFWHQALNEAGSKDEPWRTGNICTDTVLRAIRRYGLDEEPRSARERIRWHVLRAHAWLIAASQGNLIRTGHPYELPAYPREPGMVIGFAESQDLYEAWLQVPVKMGLVDLVPHPGNEKIRTVRRFTTFAGKPLLEVNWGSQISQSTKVEAALWVLLKEAPVLPPWQPPTTWCELQMAARASGVNLASLLRHVPKRFRDVRSHILLVGFPVPREFHGAVERVHWLAVRLPVLSYGAQTVPGLRPERGGWRSRDLRVVFKSSPLKWLATENWAEDQISTRGRFSPGLRSKSILLIGAGALGAAVAELLVRGGVHKITIMDVDKVQMGNLVRHALSMKEIGTHKAGALAERLNLLSPHARIGHVNENFPPKDHQSIAAVDMVIDCTADDDLLTKLSAFSWPGEKDFASLSLGFYARRLFLFTARNATFPREAMLAELQPWLREERATYKEEEHPWEGIGCWHPIFPARVDDVRLFASLAVRRLDQLVEKPGEPTLIVLERDDEGSLVRQVSHA